MNAAESSGGSRFRILRDAFEELVELPAEEQAARLSELEQHDPDLAAELSAWLASDREAEGVGGGFLARPVAEYAPGLVEDWLERNDRPERLGPYRIVELLGSGGMGEVYLAERDDGQFEQQVAIKLLKLGLDSKQIVRRFFRERQILARLEHPHIARLFDGGVAADGRPYFVMERVAGLPIDRYCGERRLSLEDRLRLFVTCCRAVEAAHRRLVVHRDLKPSNLLVSAEGELKVLDFGIAKLLDPSAAEAGLTLLSPGEVQAMTPAYAAPEQILGEEVSTATDVYALGVVLFEVLTGQRPHSRKSRSLPELARQLERETTTRPSVVVERSPDITTPVTSRQLSGDLDAIVGKALHRDPERRYASAGVLADELERFLTGRPVEARPDSWRYRLGKFVYRHRLGAAATLLVAASLIGGLFTALSQARRADAEAREARAQSERAERVKEFVLALFREASPHQRSREQPATAEELLAAGVERARSELAAEPSIQAEVLSSLASIQSTIQPSDAALALSEEAVAIARSAPDSGGPVLIETLAELSSQLCTLGRAPEAEARGREALLLAEARWGAHHPETATIAAFLVVPLMHQSRYSEARELLTRVVADLPVENPRYADGWRLQMQNLAAVQATSGRPREAVATFRRLLPVMAAANGAEHFRIGVLQVNLAEALQRDADLEGASQAAQRAITIFDQQVGKEHPLSNHARVVAGLIASEAGDSARAEALFAEANATLERIDSPGAARSHLAAGLHHLGRREWTESAAELEAGLAVLDRLGRRGGFLEALLATHLAYARWQNGEAAAAEELAQQGARLADLGSAEDEERVLPLLHLAELAASRGEVEAARLLNQQAYNLAQASFGERAALTAEAKRRLERRVAKATR